jgi:hypothetical protein|tara:strand:+ start:1706 stop:2041 length:336 start_codon:yes stop_codon:yes gene_type:complete
MTQEFENKYKYYKHIKYLATLVDTDDESPEPDVDLMSESIGDLVEGDRWLIYAAELVIEWSDNSHIYQDMESLQTIAERSNNDINQLQNIVAYFAMYADVSDHVQNRKATQ